MQGRQCKNKQRQKKAFDKRHRVVDLRPLKPGEHVWVKDMNRRGTVKTHMPAPPRSYVVKTQHGDVRRNRRHLNPTPVVPTYVALPTDVDIPIELDEGVDAAPMVVVDAPMAVVVPPARRNPVRARNKPAYLSDYVYTFRSRVIDKKVNIPLGHVLVTSDPNIIIVRGHYSLFVKIIDCS